MFNQTDSRSHKTTDENGSPEAFRKFNTKSATILVRNTGEKTATYSVQGSINGKNWIDLAEAADLLKEKSAKHSITDYWPFLRISAKSKESGKPTTLEIDFAAAAV